MEDQKRGETNEYGKNELGIESLSRPILCVFVDYLNFTDPSSSDKGIQEQQYNLISDFSISQSQFSCLNLDEYLIQKNNLDSTIAEDRELMDNILKQHEVLFKLMLKHGNLEEKLKEIKAAENKNKYEATVSMLRNLDKYFDQRDIKAKPSLINDIWEISKAFSDNDSDQNRISKSNFAKDLQKNMNEKLPKLIEKQLIVIIEEEAKKFANSCKNSLKDLLSDLSVSNSLILGASGIISLVTGAFGSVGIMALAKMGLLAVVGIVGMIVLAAEGLIALSASFFWKRESEIEKFAIRTADMIGTNEMKKKLREICEKTLNKIFLTIIHLRNEQLIQQYQ